MIAIRYLPANQVWAFVWNDQLLDIDGKRFWERREDLVGALRQKGITINKKGQAR